MDLAKKERQRADEAFQDNPGRLFKLRSENMAVIEEKLNKAVQRELLKERSGFR